MGKRVFNLETRKKLENYLKRGFTHKQISLAMDLPIQTIRSELKRNKKKGASYNAEEAQEFANMKWSRNCEKMSRANKFAYLYRKEDLDSIIEENAILKMQIEILENQLKILGEKHE